ncbi:MAG: hypothetical protein ACI4ON_04380 [Clostridia bacterium]
MRRKKNVEYQLEIERKDAQDGNMKEYDFIYPLSHIVNLDEQKIKVEELTSITEIKKTNPNKKYKK